MTSGVFLCHSICVPFGVLPLPAGAQVPIASYTCTQPSQSGTTTDGGQCNVTNGLRTCETKGGVRPDLLDSDRTVYVWATGANPFVVLDIPQGWCVGSVKMTFVSSDIIPTLSLSVHSAERLSTNTDRTMFSLVSRKNIHGRTLAVMNLTPPACGRYLRISMTSAPILLLAKIEVLNTSRYTFTDHQERA